MKDTDELVYSVINSPHGWECDSCHRAAASWAIFDDPEPDAGWLYCRPCAVRIARKIEAKAARLTEQARSNPRPIMLDSGTVYWAK